MKTKLVAFALFSIAIPAYAEPDIVVDSYVTFASTATDGSGLASLTPKTSTTHGWSYEGASGNVYFHYHFYSNNGEDFRIDMLELSHDSDGDGAYSAWIDVSGVSTPGTSPIFVLKRNGSILPNTVMKNTVVDEVMILNQNFAGRSFDRGAKWRLKTDYPDVVGWATHSPIKNFSPDKISIQKYYGKVSVIVDAEVGDSVECSIDLDGWSNCQNITYDGLTIMFDVKKGGEPKKFFRLVSDDET